MNLKSKILGIALGLTLTGGFGVLAQTTMQQNTPQKTENQVTNKGDDQACPMMKGGQMDMSKMDMSKMMKCCKKMRMMNMERPKSDEKSSEVKPNSNR